MIREFIHQAKRVLHVARKPESDEYLNVAKVTGIGIVIVGVIGFIIKLISRFAGGMTG